MSVDPGRGVPAARALVLALALTTGLVGCRQVEEAAAEVHQPSVVEEVSGREVKRVRFDERAAEQVELRTAPVVRAGPRTVVPYAALIYDDQGKSWVYTVVAPLTFERHPVVVDRVEGGRARIQIGPPVGTEVVTTGAAEVYGAELDIAGSH